MNLFDQPLRVYVRMTAIVLIVAITPRLATAEPRRPSIRETARKEVARIVAADPIVLRSAARHPQSFGSFRAKVNTGRRATLITLGMLGGLVGGYYVGAALGCIHSGNECGLTGLIGAPIGAVAGGITVAVLTR